MGKVSRTVLIPQRVNASFESNRPIAFDDILKLLTTIWPLIILFPIC